MLNIPNSNHSSQQQFIFRSVERDTINLQSPKEKKPCIGTYTPKFTLLDKYCAFTFPKSNKAVCEPSIKKRRNFGAKLSVLRKTQSSSIICNEPQVGHHMPNCGFYRQLGRKSVPNELNEKRFEYMPKYTNHKRKVDFKRASERPELFKPPEFLHEYYININKGSLDGKQCDL
jgi:hypothetical protein